MSAVDYVGSDGIGLVSAIRSGRSTAREVTDAALARIATGAAAVNAFTTVLADQARADAAGVDEALGAGREPGALAGMPFAVKNLFDIAGVTTLAGSRINAERPPATRDAAAVAALRRAGAVLVGALNMDEYAYGFTGENSHYGPPRNPHDPTRVPGGSSGGSGAAVGAGLVPLTLGSDTNGSVRVPAALGVSRRVAIPEAHRARAAAMVITAAEGASIHLADLKTRARDFDPLTRDRFLAGALVPGVLYQQAQRFRAWYRARVAEIFREVDILLAPTTPCPAPRIGQDRIVLDGVEVLTRPNLGVYTQPISFVGLPVLSVPIRTGTLPLGVQIIGAPFREAHVLRLGARLESKGVVAAVVAA